MLPSTGADDEYAHGFQGRGRGSDPFVAHRRAPRAVRPVGRSGLVEISRFWSGHAERAGWRSACRGGAQPIQNASGSHRVERGSERAAKGSSNASIASPASDPLTKRLSAHLGGHAHISREAHRKRASDRASRCVSAEHQFQTGLSPPGRGSRSSPAGPARPRSPRSGTGTDPRGTARTTARWPEDPTTLARC